MSAKALALEGLHEATAQLGRRERRWLRSVPVAAMVEALDRHKGPYQQAGASARAVESAARGVGGDEWVPRFLRLVLLRLVLRTLTSPPRWALSTALLHGRDRELVSIITTPDDESPWPMDLAADRFLKDLGLARGTLIPAGFYVLEPHRPVSAHIVGVARETRPALAAALRGGRPWVQMHLLQRRASGFGPEGSITAFRHTAELLGANRRFAGVHGSTWFHDPTVHALSPHLQWIPEHNRALHAMVFPIGTDDDAVANAIGTSRTRRRAYEEGRYLPTRWAFINWRDDVLAWAGRQRETSQAMP